MELVSKISKGSKMDQIYISKQRTNFEVGSYVLIRPLGIIEEGLRIKPYFYNVSKLEPIKLIIVEKIFHILENFVKNYTNIIIIGSFVDKGFKFNDIDIILITSEKVDTKNIESKLEKEIGIETHIILFDNKTFIEGLNTDPLYQAMLNNCITKKRFVYNIKSKFNYKLLDLHLLKSKLLIKNFDYLTGNEKYKLIRNLIAIYLFINKRKVDKDLIDQEIKKLLNLKVIEIKQNIIEKNKFLKKYKSLYNKTFEKIMLEMKHGSK